MKFARYLQETLTPEWRRAYIDYQDLKNCIAAIRREQQDKITEAPAHGVATTSSSEQAITENPVNTGSGALSPNTCTNSEPKCQLEEPMPTRVREDARIHARTGSLASTIRSFKQAKIDRAAKPPPLSELLPTLTQNQRMFFQALDAQLSKVESFYLSREMEMRRRENAIQEQIRELAVHRKLWIARHPALHSHPRAARIQAVVSLCTSCSGCAEAPASDVPAHRAQQHHRDPLDAQVSENRKRASILSSSDGAAFDASDYPYAKKKLKKAILEHYRGLLMLNNYRILNMEGFRKALKKFERVTEVPAQSAYMSEKVQLSAFASENVLKPMMQKMETSFATTFCHGDTKKAVARLRASHFHKTHHLSTFRSGILLGLAIPALVSGLRRIAQPSTRAAIPGWDGLLFVFAVFTVPVVFSLLLGLNLLVWSRSRINYPFIFDLDGRTRLSHRQYYEIPALLLATLCYAFWLSVNQIRVSEIAPTTWPLLWLGFVACVMIAPLPILSKPSRYWFHASIGRLLLPGLRHVEFADFWLGDQFCSLVFTFSNLYFVGCAYRRGFTNDWQRCSASAQDWAVPFALASLPFLIRLIQSVRRYADSGLISHLVNGGKYASGIVAYLFYFLWRYYGPGYGALFALWCLVQTVYTIYASSWDLLMDWSVLRPRAKYAFLREELIYAGHIPLYYFAIVVNVLFRFAWMLYIPKRGLAFSARSFITGMLEIIRRWQWNFYRLENEHLGNVDQYRVTREMPLPYHIDDGQEGEDSENEQPGDRRRTWTARRLWFRRTRPDNDGDSSSSPM